MGKPTTRVLAVLELLQAHDLISGAELARRLEVDPRTLRRYIAALEALGIPVVAERGRDGGYRLMHGFKLPPMMFTNDEALSLALGLLASRNLGLEESAVAGSGALSKLERVMPENLRQRMRAVSEVVTLAIKRSGAAGDGEILATLGAAALRQQRVRLHYLSPQQAVTERDVDPYALSYRAGNWYLIAYCHLRLDRRSFRLDRIQAASALPASFARPQAFDAPGYLDEAIASMPRAHSVKVLLRTSMAAAQAVLFASFGILAQTEEGVLLHAQADDLEWMARELARLPFTFTILEPAALKRALAVHAAALLALANA